MRFSCKKVTKFYYSVRVVTTLWVQNIIAALDDLNHKLLLLWDPMKFSRTPTLDWDIEVVRAVRFKTHVRIFWIAIIIKCFFVKCVRRECIIENHFQNFDKAALNRNFWIRRAAEITKQVNRKLMFCVLSSLPTNLTNLIVLLISQFRA